MNRANIEKLIRRLVRVRRRERQDLPLKMGFNIRHFLRSSSDDNIQTNGCIAAHACALRGDVPFWTIRLRSVVVPKAAEYLGITEDIAKRLFLVDEFTHSGEVTVTDAIRTLRNFLKTGEVKWDLSTIS